MYFEQDLFILTPAIIFEIIVADQFELKEDLLIFFNKKKNLQITVNFEIGFILHTS